MSATSESAQGIAGKRPRGRPKGDGTPTARERAIAAGAARAVSQVAYARKIGVSVQYVSWVLKKVTGRTSERRRLPHEGATIAAARALWDQGWTTSEIGRRLSTPEREISGNAIIGIADRNDFPERPPSGGNIKRERP
jgi:hypothetical protein